MSAKNKENRTMNVLVIKAGFTPQRMCIQRGLESLQAVVGGYIEAIYPFEERVGLVVNADGKFEGLEPNRALYDDQGEVYDIIVGDFCIVGLGEEDFTSLSTELMEIFEDRFYSPELFLRMNDKFIALPYLERRK